MLLFGESSVAPCPHKLSRAGARPRPGRLGVPLLRPSKNCGTGHEGDARAVTGMQATIAGGWRPPRDPEDLSNRAGRPGSRLNEHFGFIAGTYISGCSSSWRYHEYFVLVRTHRATWRRDQYGKGTLSTPASASCKQRTQPPNSKAIGSRGRHRKDTDP
jgi:hypothetical protein